MLPVPTSAAKPTYDGMALLFWKHVLCASEGIPVVHVVFDKYLANRSRPKLARNEEWVCQDTHQYIYRANEYSRWEKLSSQ